MGSPPNGDLFPFLLPKHTMLRLDLRGHVVQFVTYPYATGAELYTRTY